MERSERKGKVISFASSRLQGEYSLGATLKRITSKRALEATDKKLMTRIIACKKKIDISVRNIVSCNR